MINIMIDDGYRYSEIDPSVLLARFGNLNHVKKGLNFLTKNEDFIQAATFHYEGGHVMRAHRHIERTPPEKFRTEEVLLVWKGAVLCTIYELNNQQRIERILKPGDYVIVHNGGVSYEVLEDDTILLEVKSGPYPGDADLDRKLL